MKNALQIVNWFKLKNKADMMQNENAEELTQMKVMKLLYYVQGVYLVLYNKRAFDEDIYAWKYGHVVKSFHNEYSGKRSIIPENFTEQEKSDYNQIQDDSSLVLVLEAINEAYGDMSAIELMKQIKSEMPWKETKQNNVIKDALIKEYFEKEIVEKDA